MSYFNNICLLKAPQAFDIPHPQDVSDLTEICYLAGMIEDVHYLTAEGFEEHEERLSFLRNIRRQEVAGLHRG